MGTTEHKHMGKKSRLYWRKTRFKDVFWGLQPLPSQAAQTETSPCGSKVTQFQLTARIPIASLKSLLLSLTCIFHILATEKGCWKGNASLSSDFSVLLNKALRYFSQSALQLPYHNEWRLVSHPMKASLCRNDSLSIENWLVIYYCTVWISC